MNKKFLFPFFSLIILLASLIGCSKSKNIFQTAKENIYLEKTLPQYSVNINNFTEISYNNKTYFITENSIDLNELQKPIGKISQTFVIDQNQNILKKDNFKKIYINPNNIKAPERFSLKFGFIYNINNFDSSEKIAVNINNKFKIAKIKN